MLARLSRRCFSQVSSAKFNPGSAQILINLPQKGDTWFFVDNKQSVQQFIQSCQKEDPTAESIVLQKGKSALEDEANLYQSIIDSTLEEKTLQVKVNELVSEIKPIELSGIKIET